MMYYIYKFEQITLENFPVWTDKLQLQGRTDSLAIVTSEWI